MEYFRYTATEKTDGFSHTFYVVDSLDNNSIVFELKNIPMTDYFTALVHLQRVLLDFNRNYDTYTKTVLNYCYYGN